VRKKNREKNNRENRTMKKNQLNQLEKIKKKKSIRLKFGFRRLKQNEPNQTGSIQTELNRVKKDKGINIKLSFLPTLIRPSRRAPNHQDSLFSFLTPNLCLSFSLKNWSQFSLLISKVGVLFSSSNRALLFVGYSYIWSYILLLI